MAEFGYSQWRKLDNAALAFPAAAGKNDTRVFRFYCQLKERVDGKILQDALDKTMEKYPLFQAVLRKGLFWFYLERRNIRPAASMEQKPPCSKLYIRDQKSLLFEVTWYEDRINFEVFHALTDGTGALCFLRELVENYLVLAHPEVSFPTPQGEDTVTGKDQEEDSFSQYYSSREGGTGKKEKKRLAVALRGEKLPQDEMRITELVLPVQEALAKARKYGVSLTVLIASMMLWAIHEEIPRSRLHRPIALMVPVNLRNYFPSQSMTNFFGWIEVGYEFREESTLQDVLSHVKGQFEKELVKERIASRMNALVGLEKNPILRAVPLEVKQFFLMAGTAIGAKNVTAVYSNIGVVKMAEEYSPYIERFSLFASTENLQLCSCSYKNELSLGFTSKIPSDSIQRNFVNLLKKEGIPCREIENTFPGYKKERGSTGKTAFEIFTFLCIAAAVVTGMVNFMIEDRLSWGIAADAALFCSWLLTGVAYRKRRNLLKNEMWQLVLVSVLGVLWDVFTGWRGWSVNYLIPAASLAVTATIPLIAKIQRLEKQGYLFYLIQACAFGLIPLILLLAGAVSFPYLSILCAGISFLVLVGLFLFENRDTVREIRKKFRM